MVIDIGAILPVAGSIVAFAIVILIAVVGFKNTSNKKNKGGKGDSGATTPPGT